MKITYHWLKEFVDFNLSPSELQEKLDLVGIPVEGIEKPSLQMEKVIIGKILAINPHPQADKLTVCFVDIGKEHLPIVCGAKNIKPGDKVPVALPGAKLSTGEVKIAKIREVASLGIMCSEGELGISKDHSGLMLLPPDAPVGERLDQYLGLSDTILDLEIIPNRPDCLSLLGIAREVSALTGNPLKYPPLEFGEEGDEVSSRLHVKIETPDFCPRYTARVVEGVKVAPSPSWLRYRLEAVGIRSINNVVDITNYVMMELGQPIHAFNYCRINDNTIVIRKATKGEKIVTLDGIERILVKDSLVIADTKQAVAIAGIMGGQESEVSNDTNTVIIECAYFDPLNIRRTAKKLGMRTEASLRFERGVDPNGIVAAQNRTAQLLHEVAGGKIGRGLIDAYPSPIFPVEIELRPSRVNAVLGTNINSPWMVAILEKLEMKVESLPDKFTVKVPTFRPDLIREIDLIEEIARHWGYHQIPETVPQYPITPIRESLDLMLENWVREILTASGLWEVMPYSFIGERSFDQIRLPFSHPLRLVVKIRNPLDESRSLMRSTLIPGLLETLSLNFRRGNENLKIFEVGRVFQPREDPLPKEYLRISGALTGIQEVFWKDKPRTADFYDLKGLIETFLDELKISKYYFQPEEHPLFHSGRCAKIVAGEPPVSLGIMGEIHPDVQETYEFKNRVYLFEIDFEALKGLVSEVRTHSPLPKYPAVKRDIAIILRENISAQQVKEVIISSGGDLLERIELFDVYQQKPIPPNHRSLAYTLTFRSPEKTLTDQEVDSVQQKIIETLSANLDAKIRK